METYLIGICDRLHEATPILLAVNTLIFIFFMIAYFCSKEDINRNLVIESDYRLNKISKICLACCLVAFVIILLLFIFIPTGEEVRLMMQND